MDEYAYLGFPADAVHVDEAAVGRLPESARRVLTAVIHGGVMTPTELRRETAMSARTVRYAVKRLRDDGWIAARQSLRDGRTSHFFVHPDHVDERALRIARARAQDDAERMGRTIEVVGGARATRRIL